MTKPCEYLLQNTSFFVRSFLKITIAFLFLFSATIFGQTSVDRIYTDWNGYFTSNGASSVAANQPNTENNLLAFSWNGKTYATGANNAVLTANSVSFEDTRFRALKIQSLSSDSGSYYLQGSMIDGSLTNRILTPALSGAVSTPAELASRLTDGINGLALGTGVANIKSTVPSEFKVGTNNIQLGGIGDGIPDIVVTQVAQPNSTVDSFKFVDVHGVIVGNAVSVAFTSIPVMGTYRLDLFNSGNGAPASGFSANDTREIRLLAMDMTSFGITAANAGSVDRFVVTFSGSSDCAFIAFNANSLKIAELSLVENVSMTGCGKLGDVIYYNYQVTNTGEVPMTNVGVTNALPGMVISGGPVASLAVGATAVFTGAYTITASDVTAGKVTGTAKVTGTDPSLNTVESSNAATNTDLVPLAPTGTAVQTFCANNLPTIADLAVIGTAVKWYASSSGGSDLPASTALVNGTHYYASQTVYGCEGIARLDVRAVVNNPASITVQPVTPAATCTGTGTQTISVTAIGTGLTYSWQKGGSPVTNGGVISGQGTSVLTLTNPLIADAGSYNVVVTGSCSPAVISNTVAITVNPVVAIPSIGTITQPTFVMPTGSVVLNGLPVSGTVFQTGTVSSSYTITGTTMTISGLLPGTYNFSASNGTCNSAVTSSVVINAVVIKTWNGTWSPAGAPTKDDAVVINADYSVSSNGDLNVYNLVVNSGFTLTIEANHYAIIQNNLTVNGTLDLLDKGSLVMVNDAGTVNGTGTANVHRITTPFKKNDYVYWSTPVTTSPISSAVFPGWRRGYAYEYNNAWTEVNTMTPGKGCIIMVPDPTAGPNGNISEVIFSGRLNNGIQKITGIVSDRAYLLGNPYSSALDAEAFLDYNSGVIGGTLYFWTHNTAIQLASNIPGSAGSGAYAYTSDDYASYNAVGGVSVGSGSAAISGGTVPSGKIGSGQGFFATSNAVITGTNEIVFNNAMRLSPAGVVLDNSQFFKTKNPKAKTAKTIEKHRIWLNLSNDKGAFKQTLIGYVTGATNDDDSRFDGKTLDGNKFVDFYSVNQSKNLVIQGRALPFDENDEVLLGYKTAIPGNFSISIGQADGLLVNQTVFLEDKLTNTVFDLKKGDYNFTAAKGTFNDRFVLKYKLAKTLGTDNLIRRKTKYRLSVKNKQIKINSFLEAIEKVMIYDVSGKQIYKKEQVNNNEFTVANFTAADQVLIVKTTLQNGSKATQKIVF